MQWASTLAPEHIGIHPSKLGFVTRRRRNQSNSGWICTCNASRGEEAEEEEEARSLPKGQFHLSVE
jgi:hypothetical protein